MDAMSKKSIWIGMALALLGVVATSGTARADDWNKKTVITFSQPVEIPGHVLPAGTYTFKLADSLSDRHIVQIFNADGSDIIATFIAISDYRLKPTGETVIRFKEVPAGSPKPSARGSIPATTSDRNSSIRNSAPRNWRWHRTRSCRRWPPTRPAMRT